MRLLQVGMDALLVEVEDVETASALYAEARRAHVDALDIVPAARTVLFDGVRDVAALREQVARWASTTTGAAVARLPAGDGGAGSASTVSGGAAAGATVVEVPTVYDGADLVDVARRWRLTTREVVALHTSHELVVAFCGFAPGFAYCTGLPRELALPRLPTPRTRVPAGSVALANGYTGVYPTASPGGWRLIGRTSLVLWDPRRSQPATLSPGTHVRFVEATS